MIRLLEKLLLYEIKASSIFKAATQAEQKRRDKEYYPVAYQEALDQFKKDISVNCVENKDGTYTCIRDIHIYTDYSIRFTKLPVKFKEALGSFQCYYSTLTTLEGCPEKVHGNFDCSHNELTTLKYAPKYVGGYFDCSYNKLTSLKYGPKYVGDNFYCIYNQLPNLKGAPEYVKGKFYCGGNPLTSLEGVPQINRRVI